MNGLRLIEDAIRGNPTTGRARRLVRLPAAVYNRSQYLFDLTELWSLDCGLANA